MVATFSYFHTVDKLSATRSCLNAYHSLMALSHSLEPLSLFHIHTGDTRVLPSSPRGPAGTIPSQSSEPSEASMPLCIAPDIRLSDPSVNSMYISLMVIAIAYINTSFPGGSFIGNGVYDSSTSQACEKSHTRLPFVGKTSLSYYNV